MAKPKKRKNKTTINSTVKGRGPIARKVIATAKEHLQSNVTDMAAWKAGNLNAERLQETVCKDEDLLKFDPAHAAYIYAQNQLSILVEQMMDLPPLQKLAEAYAVELEQYTPSQPPMSPLTTSYFSSWGSFDLATPGAKRESFASIAVDFCRFVSVDEGLIELYDNMDCSRMGIYRHQGCEGKFVHLTELVTGRQLKALRTTEYQGKPGDLWYVRLLPSPFDTGETDFWVIFNTPYVLIDSGKYDWCGKTMEEAWLAYFDRMQAKWGKDDALATYEHLMKNGLSRSFWLEYVFLAYVNHSSECIYLSGIPDIRASLPHGNLSSPASSGI